MTLHKVYPAHTDPYESCSAWLSTRLTEWASLSESSEELHRERWDWQALLHSPPTVTQVYHAAFDRYLQD